VIKDCAGKNRWLSDFKQEVLRWLDISVPTFDSQHSADWQQVIDCVGAKWNYSGHVNGIGHACLRSHAKNIIKNENWRLHSTWKKHGSDPRMAAPPSTNPIQWSKLIHYFQSDIGKSKSKAMTTARSNVVNPNLTGRRGMAPIIDQLVMSTVLSSDLGLCTMDSSILLMKRQTCSITLEAHDFRGI
jgi:hypothetical protein